MIFRDLIRLLVIRFCPTVRQVPAEWQRRKMSRNMQACRSALGCSCGLRDRFTPAANWDECIHQRRVENPGLFVILVSLDGLRYGYAIRHDKVI
jgi:hypothetical protein